MFKLFQNIDKKGYRPIFGGAEIFKYIGPGLLVTIGFIDPGNWASNLAAGANYGYTLLWVITLSTLMLILLQHNVAHLGIASGLSLSEGGARGISAWWSVSLLSSKTRLPTVSTSERRLSLESFFKTSLASSFPDSPKCWLSVLG